MNLGYSPDVDLESGRSLAEMPSWCIDVVTGHGQDGTPEVMTVHFSKEQALQIAQRINDFYGAARERHERETGGAVG